MVVLPSLKRVSSHEGPNKTWRLFSEDTIESGMMIRVSGPYLEHADNFTESEHVKVLNWQERSFLVRFTKIVEHKVYAVYHICFVTDTCLLLWHTTCNG